MGVVTARDLTESPAVSEVVLGDVDVKKAEQIAKWIGNKKVPVRQVGDKTSLVKAMKETDAVANTVPYHLDLEMIKATMEAGKDLTDLGARGTCKNRREHKRDNPEKSPTLVPSG
jgi:lysine 6-dehydrogenase